MANENKDVREEQLKFNMLIDILRKFNDTSSFIYYLKYKKNESYYQFGVVNGKLLIRVTSKP